MQGSRGAGRQGGRGAGGSERAGRQAGGQGGMGSRAWVWNCEEEKRDTPFCGGAKKVVERGVSRGDEGTASAAPAPQRERYYI